MEHPWKYSIHKKRMLLYYVNNNLSVYQKRWLVFFTFIEIKKKYLNKLN